ncbi:MAG: response regulator [Planctomycetaceae bacterium]
MLDITERNIFEKQLQESQAHAQAADRSKSEFLANISHEIRTPMTAILGFAETLLEQDSDENERTSAVKTIIRNGEYLLEIINDILDLSKLETGKILIQNEKVQPNHIIAEVIDIMRSRADAKSLNCKLHYEGAIPAQITTDPIRLRQILINLIGNALKFTQAGGIEIRVRLDQQETESYLEFDIIDSGCGIPMELQKNLFQPVSLADNSISHRFGKTGLGLTISKKMAELLGEICTWNPPTSTKVAPSGSGLPLAISRGVKLIENMDQLVVSEPKTELGYLETEDQFGAGHRVLLVEDGPDNQKLITYVLRKQGFEIAHASNGQQGFEMALSARDAAHPYDIVLMDMQMPIMDGFQATSALRDSRYEGPIIALTALSLPEEKERCLEAGCDEHVSKPINRQKLTDILRKYVSKSRDRVEADSLQTSL